MPKIKVLFVCVHNSARSQMAEAFLNDLAGDIFEAKSAGLEPGKLNPVVVEVMKETGIDISGKKTQGVFDLLKKGERFAYVITVCDEASGERCPLFPGVSKKLHWGFTDPSSLEGTPDEKLAKTREIRNMIKIKVEEFISQLKQGKKVF
ncbi:MAG: arsenate reductase ArsC [Elusimicrobia bacterium]|nr:arsenate reductase ArsC [Candidatus Liberimonas magnetica]